MPRNTVATGCPGRNGPTGAICFVLALLSAVSLASVTSGQGASTPIGPGVAGQLHAVAFDSQDAHRIYVGSDQSGVYRTTNSGGNWELWSQGLDPDFLSKANYIDDLVVVEDYVYAATHAGIYRRHREGSTWEHLTRDLTYTGGYADLYFNVGVGTTLPIPFSCFAYDDETGYLYAGAGHARAGLKSNQIALDSFYPAGGEGTRYTLWRCAVQSGSTQWEPVPGTDSRGLARHIAIAGTGVGRYVLVATSMGVFFARPELAVPVVDIVESGGKSAGWRAGYSDDAWGVAEGANGRVYMLMGRDGIFDENGEVVVVNEDTVAVWTANVSSPDHLADLSNWTPVQGTGDHWNYVFPHGPVNGGAYKCSGYLQSMTEIVSDTTYMLSALTVFPGDVGTEDTIYLGCIAGKGGGFFRLGDITAPGPAGGPAVARRGWSHALYSSVIDHTVFSIDYRGEAAVQEFDHGWHVGAMWAYAPLVHSSVDPSRLYAITGHMPVLSTDGGNTWAQVFCDGSGQWWSSRGINVMGVLDIDCSSTGQLAVAPEDVGIVISNDGGSFNWISSPGDGALDTYDVEYSVQGDGGDLLYGAGRFWIGERFKCQFAVYDAVGDSFVVKSSQIDDIYEALGEGDSGDADRVGGVWIQRIEFATEDDVFVVADFDSIYTNPSTGAKSRYPVSLVYRGERVGPDRGPAESWQWSEWYDSRDDSPGGRFITDLEYIESRDLLIASTWGRYGLSGGVLAFDAGAVHGVAAKWLSGTVGVADPLFAGAAHRNYGFVKSLLYEPVLDYLYVGSTGPVQVDSDSRGGVSRVPGAEIDGYVSDHSYIPVAEVIANDGVNTFGFTTDSSWFPPSAAVQLWEYATGVYDFAVDPSDPSTVYAGIGGRNFNSRYGIWKYRDGDGWSQLLRGNDGETSGVASLAFDPTTPGRLYYGSLTQELFVTSTNPAIPSIEAEAEHALAAGRTTNAPVAVRIASTSGYEVTSVEIDLGPLGTGFGVVALDDAGPAGGVGDLVAGDGVWSRAVDAAAVAAGTYTLQVTSRDAFWLTTTAPVEQEVVVLPAAVGFVDRSVYDQGTAGKRLAVEYESAPYASVSIDFDGAGTRDLLVSFVSSPLELYATAAPVVGGGIAEYNRTDPQQVFQFGASPENILGMSVADIQGDGAEDFFAASQNNSGIFLRVGGLFSDFTPSLGLADVVAHSTCGSWVDYDRDGDVDLFVGRGDYGSEEPGAQQVPRAGALLRNDITSGSGLTDVSASAGIADGLPVSITTATWGDIDGDAFPDLFVGDAAGGLDGSLPSGAARSKLFLNNGDGTFVEQSETLLASEAWHGVAGAVFRDLNTDGRLDLALATHLGLRLHFHDEALGYSNGLGLANESGSSPVYGALSFLDFDCDGTEDILLLPASDTAVPRLFCDIAAQGDDAPDLAGAAGLLATGRVSGVLVADMNADGDADVFLGRTPVPDDPGTPDILESPGNLFEATSDAVPTGAHWIGVRLNSSGRANNSMGIGARVTVHSAAGELVRYIDGGSGRGGQESPELVISLGSVASVDLIAVDWPNGRHQVVTVPATDQYHDIVDDSVLGFVKKSIVGTFEIVPNTEPVDLVFRWKTNVLTNPYWDRVEFESSTCAPWLMTLTPQTPGVEHTTEVLADNTMLHELVWRDRPCVAPCTVQFRVGSSTDGSVFAVISPNQTLRFDFCPSTEFPHAP